MVRVTPDHKICVKILYWGIAGSGKTTIVDTLHRLTQEYRKDLKPMEDVTKKAMVRESTKDFDRGIFQSTQQENLFYHIYTVVPQSIFSPLRKKLFKGTDGVIFVIDSQKRFLEDNIEALKILKSITKNKLVKDTPLAIMLNKQDLPEVISVEDFMSILIKEKLWHESMLIEDFGIEYIWNPIIYKTCALYHKRRNVYRSFSECVRKIWEYSPRVTTLKDGDNDYYPYPYIFKPPAPPGDMPPAGQSQAKPTIIEEESESELFCQYCGSKLRIKQDICEKCGAKLLWFT